jgi:hypothetical protein
MTEAEVNRFEASLELKLPAAYRHLLTHFPIRFARVQLLHSTELRGFCIGKAIMCRFS